MLLVAALRADDLPVIGGGDTYHAMFTEAGGLKVNDEVRIAGVRVGKVDEIELAGDQVKVSFKVDDAADFGRDTRAAIKVKTILGSMFLALEPAGGGQLDEGATIPAERTSSPFDVVEAFEGLASTSEQIDTDQLAESLTTLADLTRNTPDEFRGALSGLSRLSANVAARTSSSTPAGQPRARLDGPRRARRGHHRADGGQRRAVPRAGGPPGGRPRPPRLQHHAVQGAHHARSASRARTSSRRWRTSRTSSPCSTRTRTTSTAACG